MDRTSIVTTDDSGGSRVFSGVRVSVSFLHDISKIDAARMTKRYTEMFHQVRLG